MKNKRRITGILAAMLLAIIGTVALVGYVNSAKDKAVAKEALVDVYVVDRLVPKGAEAKTIRSSVSLAKVPARLEQKGALTDLNDVGENVASADLQPGDQLVAARLVPKDKVSDGVTDKVQVSASLAAEQAVGGSIHKGDLVGVYLSFDPFTTDAAGAIVHPASPKPAAAIVASAPIDATTASDATSTTLATTQTPNVTRLEFQHVLVTNVQTTDVPVNTDTKNSTTTKQVTSPHYIVTLALSPEQSERFVFATQFGHVWLSTDPASVSDDGTKLVTLGNVYSVSE